MIPEVKSLIVEKTYSPKSSIKTSIHADLILQAKAYVQTKLWEAVSKAWQTFREGIHEQAVSAKKSHELREQNHRIEEGIFRSKILFELDYRQARVFDLLEKDSNTRSFI